MLFVVLRAGLELDDELRRPGSHGALRDGLSPRHAPDDDRRRAGDPAHADRQEARAAGQAHPHRHAGGGRRSADALVDPAAIEPFVAYARTRVQLG